LPDGGQFTGAQSYPALVLNADFRPLSYFPLSVWSWQDAVKAVFLDRVSVLSEYEVEVHSPSLALRLPSVIALKEYIPIARRPAFTRFNVFLRDRFECQYCGQARPTHELTFDHVIPRSRGGRTSWENVVTACGPCNLRKGNHMPRECHMLPRQAPRQPTTWELQENGRGFPPNATTSTGTASWRAERPSLRRGAFRRGLVGGDPLAEARVVRFPLSRRLLVVEEGQESIAPSGRDR
jgi:5-methylcytosine-specific restriction endonuclease McrA